MFHQQRSRGPLGASRARGLIPGAALLLGGLSLAMPGVAPAQTYPGSRSAADARFAAAATDIIARVTGAKLSEILGQQIYSRTAPVPPAIFATEAVARSEADGYTIMLTPLSNAAMRPVSRRFKIEFAELLAPIALIAETAVVLVVHPSLDVNAPRISSPWPRPSRGGSMRPPERGLRPPCGRIVQRQRWRER